MGPTKVFKTIYEDPTCIRALYGTTDTRNATHGSDSEANAKLEMNFFFPEFDYEAWHREEEDYLSQHVPEFNEKLVIHQFKNK